jgi:hypothetical protein
MGMCLYFVAILLHSPCIWAGEPVSVSHGKASERTEELQTEKSLEHFVVTNESMKAPRMKNSDEFEPTLSSIVPFYRLRIRFATTSDWTTLAFENPENILTMRVVSVQSDPEEIQAQPRTISIKQALHTAKPGKTAGLTVDLAVNPRATEEPLIFILQKGNIGRSTLTIWDLKGTEPILLQQIVHRTTVGKDAELNPFSFRLDLSSLKERAPDRKTVRRFHIKKRIWAFYYPWYRIHDWESPILKDRPNQTYTSDNPSVMRRHIELAKSASIDGFIVSWWGPNDYTDNNLKLLLDLASEMNFRIMIYYETLKGDNFKNPSEIVQRLRYAVSKCGSHPAYMKIGGKPVIPIFSSAKVSLKIWENVFATLRTKSLDAFFLAMGYDIRNLEIFDGLHEYVVHAIPSLDETLRSTGQMTHEYPLLSDSERPRLWSATVQPGYDDLLIPGRRGSLKNRKNGSAYRTTFEAAVKSNPDWIFITSWNEWWENTHIEPGERFGDRYLALTKQFADRWRP